MADHGHGPCCSGPGSPTRAELVTLYEERTGFSVERPRLFLALDAAAVATVWSEFHARALDADGESGWAPLVEWMVLTAADYAGTRS